MSGLFTGHRLPAVLALSLRMGTLIALLILALTSIAQVRLNATIAYVCLEATITYVCLEATIANVCLESSVTILGVFLGAVRFPGPKRMGPIRCQRVMRVVA